LPRGALVGIIALLRMIALVGRQNLQFLGTPACGLPAPHQGVVSAREYLWEPCPELLAEKGMEWSKRIRWVK
jgi:hypothetical protein